VPQSVEFLKLFVVVEIQIQMDGAILVVRLKDLVDSPVCGARKRRKVNVDKAKQDIMRQKPQIRT